MRRAAKLIALILPLILASAATAGGPSHQIPEGSLREYPVYCTPEVSCEAAISPVASEVAMFDPARDPKPRQSLISIYGCPRTMMLLPKLTLNVLSRTVVCGPPHPVVEPFLR